MDSLIRPYITNGHMQYVSYCESFIWNYLNLQKTVGIINTEIVLHVFVTDSGRSCSPAS